MSTRVLLDALLSKFLIMKVKLLRKSPPSLKNKSGKLALSGNLTSSELSPSVAWLLYQILSLEQAAEGKVQNGFGFRIHPQLIYNYGIRLVQTIFIQMIHCMLQLPNFSMVLVSNSTIHAIKGPIIFFLHSEFEDLIICEKNNTAYL